MPELPFLISSPKLGEKSSLTELLQGTSKIVQDMQFLMDDLFQERIGGANLGDVFLIGDDDILALNLATAGGLEKSGSQLQIKIKSTGGMNTTADGLAIKLDAGLSTGADGERVAISPLTAKAAPIGADLVIIEDTEASNVLKKITLSNLLGTAHTHDGETLQHDGVNSDGGAFAFTTTGAVTFNQNIGIGTSSPGTRLQIGDSTVNSSNKITLGKTASTAESNLPTISQASVLTIGSSNDLLLKANSTSAGVVLENRLGNRMVLNRYGNVGIGASSFDATMAGGFAMATGTAPAGDVADQFAMYSADIAAGNAAPHFRTENAEIIKMYQQAHIADADGTEAGNKATIDTILVALENTGLLANA